jgi:hypothetical protein
VTGTLKYGPGTRRQRMASSGWAAFSGAVIAMPRRQIAAPSPMCEAR